MAKYFCRETKTMREHWCSVCDRTDHSHRTLRDGTAECPCRVIRILPEPGSSIDLGDPGIGDSWYKRFPNVRRG